MSSDPSLRGHSSGILPLLGTPEWVATVVEGITFFWKNNKPQYKNYITHVLQKQVNASIVWKTDLSDTSCTR